VFVAVAFVDLLTLTGPFTPVVFVVVAFVVDVDPLTTVTGPLAPEVPVVSAALAKDGAKKMRAARVPRAPRWTRVMGTGSSSQG
jgi:hypothetical protein